MKKITALLVVGLLTISLSSAAAVGTSTEERLQQREETREEMQLNRTATVTQMQERHEERVENREQRRSEIAERHAVRLNARFTNYYERLTRIANKIQSRIETVKAAGKDTATAQAKLDAALVQLETAKTAGEAAVAQFQAIDADTFETQRELALAARDKAEEARVAFKAAMEDLHAAVDALKALR